jgi:hypothetical protein
MNDRVDFVLAQHALKQRLILHVAADYFHFFGTARAREF